MPVQPGEFKNRVTFAARGAATPDRYGNTDTDWADQFTRWAKLIPLRGGENVMEARLAGRQPYIVVVYRDPETELITTDWRAVNAEDASQVFNVRNVTPGEDVIDLLCEVGVVV